MSASATASHARAASIASILLLVLALASAGALAYRDLRGSLDRLTLAVQAQERTIQLYRFEQQSKGGLGLPALLEQLRYWCPQLGLATTPAAHIPQIEERLRAIVAAIVALGPEVFDRLVDTFEHDARSAGDEVRGWIARALVEVDRERAKGFLARIVRSLDIRVPTRLRLVAADELTRLDQRAAGEVLRLVLTTETWRGLEPERLPAELRARYPDAAASVIPAQTFSTFVQRYADTGDAETVPTLLMVLGRRDVHDVITLQECVKILGKCKALDAVAALEGLFENPPAGYTPMFRNHCLDALVEILGPQACEWLREQLRHEQAELVRGKLASLIQKACG